MHAWDGKNLSFVAILSPACSKPSPPLIGRKIVHGNTEPPVPKNLGIQ